MRRIIVAGAIAILLAVAAANAPLGVAETPPTHAPQAQQEPAKLRNGCTRLFTRKQFKGYATKVYRRRSLSRKAGARLTRMTRCQHSPHAERWARKARRRLKAARRERLSLYCGSPTCNRRLALYLAGRRYGSSGANCLVWIGDNEGSGWRPTTWNSGGSGAYGIPQALPGSKMATHGADWRTSARTQLHWMMDYVDNRYGGPCPAVGYWRAHRAY